MKWASHLSTKDNVEACIHESVEVVHRQMEDDPVHLTFIFVSQQFKQQYEKIPGLIR